MYEFFRDNAMGLMASVSSAALAAVGMVMHNQKQHRNHVAKIDALETQVLALTEVVSEEREERKASRAHTDRTLDKIAEGQQRQEVSLTRLTTFLQTLHGTEIK